MNLKIRPFSSAYRDFYKSIEKSIAPGISICEIGGGAFPLIDDKQISELGIEYTIVDPDKKELEKAKTIGKKVFSKPSELPNKYNESFDLIISRMVLEHVEDPAIFHASILNLLKPGGKAVHFFASLYGLPSLINLFLPESFGSKLLHILGNRNLDEAPKYKAYYNRCFGPGKKSTDFYCNLGFNIEKYFGYVGHTYGKHIFILRSIEKAYNWILYKSKCKILNTLSLIIMSKPNPHF